MSIELAFLTIIQIYFHLGEQKIFACGSDQEGQLGRGSNAAGDSSSSPVMVHDFGIAGPKVIQLSAGSHHSMVLTNDGSVLVWGSNLEGQLGLPGTTGLVHKPTIVQIPENIKLISAGYYHSAFLTGMVFKSMQQNIFKYPLIEYFL